MMTKTFPSPSGGLIFFPENSFSNIFTTEVLLLRPGLSLGQCSDHHIVSLTESWTSLVCHPFGRDPGLMASLLGRLLVYHIAELAEVKSQEYASSSIPHRVCYQ